MRAALKKIKRLAVDAVLGSTYTKKCSVCGKRVKGFIPLPEYYLMQSQKYNFPYSADEAETLNVGEYTCPNCGASDRDRLYALYLEQEIKPTQSYKLLDIAPAKALRNFLKKKTNINYRSGDLLQEDVDDRGLDITNMKNYADSSFDIFICSHVLEHVDDDIKAMRELYRILEINGFGIAMVPIITTIENIDEDPSVTDDGERWRRFGQGDHVRLYSRKGYIGRLRECGFIVKEITMADFGESVFVQYGLSPKSVLYIVKK